MFLVGGNGSGKTTLVKLITGLYAPGAGTVQLDGRPVGPEQRDEYRQLFSVVFADGHLFKTLLGLEPASFDARARRAWPGSSSTGWSGSRAGRSRPPSCRRASASGWRC